MLNKTQCSRKANEKDQSQLNPTGCKQHYQKTRKSKSVSYTFRVWESVCIEIMYPLAKHWQIHCMACREWTAISCIAIACTKCFFHSIGFDALVLEIRNPYFADKINYSVQINYILCELWF